MEYAVIIEQGERNYSAYVPDLPGCVATGETEEEVLELIRQGMELHLESMREDGESIPSPGTHIRYVKVKSAA
jgi:predicted RNase H-like HicB family nuclease